MKQEDKPIFEKLTDAQAMALTIYGEARGEGLDGMLAVGSVILHRSNLGYFGKGIKGVCFKPFQFSCFTAYFDKAGKKPNPEYPILLRIAKNFIQEAHDKVILATCLSIAEGLISGETKPNITASFYKRTDVRFPEGFENKLVEVMRIGNHVFYREPGDHMA